MWDNADLCHFFSAELNPGTWELSEKILKGKFSSGIEGALASTLNHDFNWKQLSEVILCIFLLMFLSNIDSETAER